MSKYTLVAYSTYENDLNVALKAYNLIAELEKIKNDPDFAEYTKKPIEINILPKLKSDTNLTEEQHNLGYAYIDLIEKLTSLQSGIKNCSSNAEIKGHAENVHKHALGLVAAILAGGKKDIDYIKLAADLLKKSTLAFSPGFSTKEQEQNLKSLKSSINSFNYKLELEGWRGSLHKAGRLFVGAVLTLVGALTLGFTVSSMVGLVISGAWRLATKDTKNPNWGPLSLGWRVFNHGLRLWENGPTLFQQKAAQKLSDSSNNLRKDMAAANQTIREGRKLSLHHSSPSSS